MRITSILGAVLLAAIIGCERVESTSHSLPESESINQKRFIPARKIGKSVAITGKLGIPLGTMVTIVGEPIEAPKPPSKSDLDYVYVKVISINGLSADANTTIRVKLHRFSWQEPPELKNGRCYS